MKRKMIALLIALLSVSWLPTAVVGFEASGLLYVSWGGLPGGTSTYTGPVCEVIAEYWFGNHGYQKFWRDLNGDRMVNERDAEELVEKYVEDWIGIGYFDPSHGMHDYELLGELCWYFGKAYPGQFKVKVYDDSIAQEMIQHRGEGSDPSGYEQLGVSVELYGNATRQDYASDLQAGAVVIVGLGKEGGFNSYLVGRSFETQASGSMWPVGLLETADDPFQAGFQAQDLDTYLRQGDSWWMAQYGTWIPIECMLSILPVSEASGTSGTMAEPGRETTSDDCSGDTRLTQRATADGSFTVLETEHRDVGGIDFYTYELTSVSVSGLCSFSIPNNGLSAVNLFSDSPCWLLDTTDLLHWKWTYNDQICQDAGLMPGESVTFGVEVPSPTADVQVAGEVDVCSGTGSSSTGGAAAQQPVEIPDVSGEWNICYGGSCGTINITQTGVDFHGQTSDIPGYKGYVIDGAIDLNRTVAVSSIHGFNGWYYPVSASILIDPDGLGAPITVDTDTGRIGAASVYSLGDPSKCEVWGFTMPLNTYGEFDRSGGRTACLWQGDILPIVPPTAPSTYSFQTCVPQGDTAPPAEVPRTDCDVEPQSILFTSTTVGGQSSWRSFEITNTGSTTISGSITLTGHTADFELKSCSSYYLLAGRSVKCDVRFTPKSEGLREAYVTIGPAGGSCPDIRLRGTAKAEATCPDLVITDLWACYIDPGQNEGSVRIQGWVKNVGTASAAGCALTIYFSESGSWFPTIINENLGTIEPNHRRSFDISVFPVDVATGAPFGVDARVGCTETECNSNNNDKWVQASGTCE